MLASEEKPPAGVPFEAQDKPALLSASLRGGSFLAFADGAGEAAEA
jgi:hypothetical protein